MTHAVHRAFMRSRHGCHYRAARSPLEAESLGAWL